MRKAVDDALKRASDHPLIAGWLAPLFIITLAIGVIHECRIGGDVLIVLVRHAKEELGGLADVGRRLRHELTTWDTEEPAKKPDTVSTARASRGPNTHQKGQ
jgi:hypothetical protein